MDLSDKIGAVMQFHSQGATLYLMHTAVKIFSFFQNK